MGTPFKVGDEVAWYAGRVRLLSGKLEPTFGGGIITKIHTDIELMIIFTGFASNPSGGCMVWCTAKKISGRWCAFKQGPGDYLCRIYRRID